jgi:hypothetical protein
VLCKSQARGGGFWVISKGPRSPSSDLVLKLNRMGLDSESQLESLRLAASTIDRVEHMSDPDLRLSLPGRSSIGSGQAHVRIYSEHL